MKVLFTTDGSRASFEAERWLTEIGNRATVDVTVLTVGDLQGRVISAPNEATQRSGWEARTVADATRSRVEREGFEVTSMVARGEPSEEIARRAGEGGFGLTLMGCSRALAGSWPIPSAGSQVLTSSRSALLIGRSRPRNRVQVLVVRDDSDDSQAAANCFREFADPLRSSATSVSLSRVPFRSKSSEAVSLFKDERDTEAPLEEVGNDRYGLIVCGVSVDAGVQAAQPFVEGVLGQTSGVLLAHA
jgi:nucleotide-binding universal stress UspA family protein